MERTSGERLSKTVLVIGYGWKHPRKSEEERQFRREKRKNKGQQIPIYPSLPPSEMSKVVDDKAVDMVRAGQAEIIVYTGTRMGHINPFPATQENYFKATASNVPVKNIGKAWTTSREVRRYFRYLRDTRQTEGLIVFLDTHDRVEDIGNKLSKKRRYRELDVKYVKVKDTSIEQTYNYQRFAQYEVGARKKQQFLESIPGAAPLADYVFRFKRTPKTSAKTGVV